MRCVCAFCGASDEPAIRTGIALNCWTSFAERISLILALMQCGSCGICYKRATKFPIYMYSLYMSWSPFKICLRFEADSLRVDGNLEVMSRESIDSVASVGYGPCILCEVSHSHPLVIYTHLHCTCTVHVPDEVLFGCVCRVKVCV